MARRARVEFHGAVYHVLDRGDRREAVFLDDADRRMFLTCLSQACGRTGWRVHAWVLMGNHYHLLLETPEPNLVVGMHWLQTTYTVRFNRRHRLCGHLFQGRYKAVLVDPEEPGYFSTLSDYIHLNPVRARLIGLDDRLVDYEWSSYPAFALGRPRPCWLEVQRVLGEMGVEDTAAGRYRYAERMRQRAVATLAGENEELLRQLRGGSCLGGEGFREKICRIGGKLREHLIGEDAPSSLEREAWDLLEARRLIETGLEHFGLDGPSLESLRKGDPRKLAIAVLVRERTTVARAWLARQLALGHVSRLNSPESQSPEVETYARVLREILQLSA